MDSLETVIAEIDALERQLSRRGFLKLATLAAVVPTPVLTTDNAAFLRGVSATLIPFPWLRDSGIDVVVNVERLLGRMRHEHRVKLLRLVTWARRISFLYGGDKIAIRSRGSRFVLVRKLGKALSSVCLVAFWGDPRSLRYIDVPGVHS
jgi:hypothetical protein